MIEKEFLLPDVSDVDALAIATRYLDDPKRPSSSQDERARKVVIQTATILATISRFVSAKSRLHADAEFDFRFDPAIIPTGPAGMARANGRRLYGVRFSLAFIEKLFDRIAVLKEVPSRNYDPAAFVIISSVTALAHEYAHGLYGHKEGVQTDISRSLYLEELDADRRAGAGTLALFSDWNLRKTMDSYVRLRDPIDFLEAALVGHSLLAWTIQSSDSDLYAGPGMRAYLYFDGFRSAVLQTGFADFSQINTFARTNADRVAQKVADLWPDGQELLAIRAEHDISERLMDEFLRERIYARTDETVIASPFWKPFFKKDASER